MEELKERKYLNILRIKRAHLYNRSYKLSTNLEIRILSLVPYLRARESHDKLSSSLIKKNWYPKNKGTSHRAGKSGKKKRKKEGNVASS